MLLVCVAYHNHFRDDAYLLQVGLHTANSSITQTSYSGVYKYVNPGRPVPDDTTDLHAPTCAPPYDGTIQHTQVKAGTQGELAPLGSSAAFEKKLEEAAALRKTSRIGDVVLVSSTYHHPHMQSPQEDSPPPAPNTSPTSSMHAVSAAPLQGHQQASSYPRHRFPATTCHPPPNSATACPSPCCAARTKKKDSTAVFAPRCKIRIPRMRVPTLPPLREGVPAAFKPAHGKRQNRCRDFELLYLLIVLCVYTDRCDLPCPVDDPAQYFQ